MKKPRIARIARIKLHEIVRDERGCVVGRIAGWRMDGSPVVVPKQRWRLTLR